MKIKLDTRSLILLSMLQIDLPQEQEDAERYPQADIKKVFC